MRILASQAWACDIGIPIADNLHPVGNPAVDTFGNIYTTFSGSRGQKVAVAVYKIDLNYSVKPFINDLMSATGLAFDPQGRVLYGGQVDRSTLWKMDLRKVRRELRNLGLGW